MDTGLLSDCLPEVTRMARKFTHISTVLQYLHLSLTCMCEAWEDILMQMDLRLTKFVQVSYFTIVTWSIKLGIWTKGQVKRYFCLLGEEHQHTGSRWVSGASAMGTIEVKEIFCFFTRTDYHGVACVWVLWVWRFKFSCVIIVSAWPMTI